ncbi:hypothetical protein ABT026_27360 [Streptomyces sp. NPDC002734]|uniref:hypothetical protein n=1 Tax=Streptomyces sp. NPDC002734 TaxID=3154426 RepID=UPI00331DBCD7
MGRFVAACVAVPVLASCGGTDGDEARTKPSGDAGKATPAAEETAPVTRASAEREVRAAVDAGGFGQPRFVDLPKSDITASCVVYGHVRTPEDPDEKSVRSVVAALEKNGWRRTGGFYKTYGSLFSLEREEWTLDVMTGSLTADQMAAAAPDASAEETQEFTGMTVTVIDRECAHAAIASAKASPR